MVHRGGHHEAALAGPVHEQRAEVARALEQRFERLGESRSVARVAGRDSCPGVREALQETRRKTLADVVAPGVATQDGGPIEKVTGIQGKAESVDPPNNNGYERTLRWTKGKTGRLRSKPWCPARRFGHKHRRSADCA